MPELITATIAASPPNSISSNVQFSGASDKNRGDAAANAGPSVAERGLGEAGPAKRASNDPFANVLKKQLAKNDSASSSASSSPIPIINKGEAATSDATASVLTALAVRFASITPNEQTETPDGPATSIEDEFSPDLTLENPPALNVQSAEMVVLPLATTVTALVQAPLEAMPTAAALTPLASKLLPQDPMQRLGDDTKSNGPPPQPADLKVPLTALDGKISLGAAITAEDIQSSSDRGDTKFQVLLDSRSQQAQAPVTQATSQVSSAPILRIDTPAGQAGWPEEMGQKLTWMATNTRQQADLVLTPPNLGRIEVSLTINGDQATATFATSNASVRDMIENSMPRLREILAESGIDLGQTHVGSESASQFSGDKSPERSATSERFPGSPLMSDRIEPNTGFVRTTSGRGMVDIFA